MSLQRMIPSQIMTDTNDETGNAPLTNLEHTLPNFDINTKDILKAINDLKTNKNPGLDDIYPKILKETKSETVGALTSLFNLSI